MELTCDLFHKDHSCIMLVVKKFFVMIKYSIKLYLIIHGLNTIAFKYKKLKSKKLELLLELLNKVIRSALFMTGFVCTLRASTCLVRHLFKTYNIYLCLFNGMLCSLSSLFDSSQRVMDYTLFMLPRCLEGMSDLICKLQLFPSIPYFENFLFAISIATALLLRKQFEIPSSYIRYIDYIFGGDFIPEIEGNIGKGNSSKKEYEPTQKGTLLSKSSKL